MADFDVGALSLSVPPTSAVIQAYRPAVLVRNNGVHDALASGSLRIYSPAGLCIFTTEIYSGTIAPGESKPAQSVDYWTPPALGRYQVIAYVSCINDQVESNNSLPPCFVTVGPGAPEEPTTVPIHASQHEEGGPDELNLDGLHGRATDAQTPLGHKATHEATGSDALDVTGLSGKLADGQPLADHAQTHEADGGDRINVEGLHGQLFNVQKPDVHDNSAHDPNYSVNKHGSADHTTAYATQTAFETHRDKDQVHGTDPYHVLSDYHTTDDPAPHDDATNLEHTANKGAASGYPELDETSHVPPEQLGLWTTPPPSADKALLANGTWDHPAPAAHHLTHEAGGSDPVTLQALFLTAKGAALSITGIDPPSDFALLNVTTPFLHQNQSIRFSLHCSLTTALGEAGALGFWFIVAGALKGGMATLMASNHTYRLELEGTIHACSTNQFAGSLSLTSLRDDGTLLILPGAIIAPFSIPVTDTWMKIIANITGLAGTHLDRLSYFVRTELPASA